MHGVNLDLLRAASSHHPDGQPKDPHAHHRAELQARISAARRDIWHIRLSRWRGFLSSRASATARICSDPQP